MLDTGWVICGTGASDGTVGTVEWDDPGNITADDASEAWLDGPAKDAQSEYIKGSNFGLSVPTGATIDGIETRAQLHDANGVAPVAYITHAQVEHPSTGFGDDQEAGTTALTGTAADYDYGGSSELHGETWTAANVNDSSFAVAYSINVGNGGVFAGEPLCDAIWVKVHYTPAPGRTQFYIIG
ncbi:MAG: hypothetical protein GY933_00165 [Hyphomicrobiales bacterium]|nr:hypothetical protein [Hyphomicrobiales bacterium]